jgi:hypothetical protein
MHAIATGARPFGIAEALTLPSGCPFFPGQFQLSRGLTGKGASHGQWRPVFVVISLQPHDVLAVDGIGAFPVRGVHLPDM